VPNRATGRAGHLKENTGLQTPRSRSKHGRGGRRTRSRAVNLRVRFDIGRVPRCGRRDGGRVLGLGPRVREGARVRLLSGPRGTTGGAERSLLVREGGSRRSQGERLPRHDARNRSPDSGPMAPHRRLAAFRSGRDFIESNTKCKAKLTRRMGGRPRNLHGVMSGPGSIVGWARAPAVRARHQLGPKTTFPPFRDRGIANGQNTN